MSAETKPFLALAKDLTSFVRAPEVRLLNIVTSAEDRELVLVELAVSEGHAANQSPFFTLEDAHQAGNAGWAARGERMRVLYQERRAARAGQGAEVPPLPPLVHADNEVATFGRACVQVAAAYEKAKSPRGLVVVVAPARMERPGTFEAALRTLVETPPLEAVRFVVVDIGSSSVAALVRKLGEERAMEATCIVDRKELHEERKRRTARAASASSGALPGARAGFAAPTTAPPARAGRPAVTTLSPEILAALGATGALAGKAGDGIRRDVYAAAHALQNKRGEDALRHQRAAADSCIALGLVREGCVLELVLAAYHLQLQQPRLARDVYTRVAARAEPVDKALAARAWLGLGAVLAVQRDARDSILAYTRAGELAHDANEVLVAIEAFRLAGQVALEAKAPTLAMSMWQRALGVAETIPTALLAGSSAATTARALAAACARRGLKDQASSLLEQADRLEQQTQDPGPSE